MATHIYVISSLERIKKDQYKVGKFSGSRSKLLSRYRQCHYH